MYPTQTLLQLHSWISHYPRFSQIQRYYCILSHRVASYPYIVVLYQYSVAIYRMYCIASYRNAMYCIESYSFRVAMYHIVFVSRRSVSHRIRTASQCITSYSYRVAMYHIVFLPRRNVSHHIRTASQCIVSYSYQCIASYSYHVISFRIAMYYIIFVSPGNVLHCIFTFYCRLTQPCMAWLRQPTEILACFIFKFYFPKIESS